MKAEYQHLKLIIECPTRIAWDNVLSIFPKNNKGNELGTTPGFYMDWETNWDESYLRVIDGISESCGKLPTPLYDITYEHLTYPEFEARFLNKNDMNIENIINKAVEGLEQAASTLSKVQEMLKNRSEPEPEKKVWTVEEICEPVTDYYFVLYKKSEGGKYFSSEGELCRTTTKSAKQVLAFCQLLTVAHWANEGGDYDFAYAHFATIKDGKPFRYETDFLSADNRKMPSPLMFKSIESYDKFLSVHGVEDLLKTFFGIEEDAK